MPGKKQQSPDVEAKVMEGAAPSSPVSLVIFKRLRAARKKLNRIQELEARLAGGTPLTEEQTPVVAGKTAVLATIEELEKLAPLMVDAVKEEVDLVRKKAQEDAQAAVTKREAAARAEAEAASAERERKLQTTLAEATAAGDSKLKEAINKLVTLGYFSSLFDPEGPWSCLHERQAFLTYGTRLSEADVMALAGFGRLMRTRAYGELASHKEALAGCLKLALAYVNSDDVQTAKVHGGMPASTVASNLAVILGSTFSTIQPQQQAPPTPPVPAMHGGGR